MQRTTLAPILALLLCGAGSHSEALGKDPPLRRYRFAETKMGVSFALILYAPDENSANAAAEAAYREIDRLNAILSDYEADSELSKLSATAGTGRAVPVSQDLWAVLAPAQRLARQTGGAFDITVGPLTKLWRRARRTKQMPSKQRLEEALAAVGFRHLRLDRAARTARLEREGMRLDLGGIAKGYAADRALAVLRQRGVRRALVDGSGDIALGEPPPGQAGWRVGIAPPEPEAPPTRFLVIASRAVATSGDAWQHVEIDGKRYSHIVNPRTGLGLTDRSSVTIVAPDCTTADSLASAVSVLGPEKGLRLVEATDGAAAYIVRNVDGKAEVHTSKRWRELKIVEQKSAAGR